MRVIYYAYRSDDGVHGLAKVIDHDNHVGIGQFCQILKDKISVLTGLQISSIKYISEPEICYPCNDIELDTMFIYRTKRTGKFGILKTNKQYVYDEDGKFLGHDLRHAVGDVIHAGVKYVQIVTDFCETEIV